MEHRCQNHLDRIADRQCACCDKFICADCAMSAESGASVCSINCSDRLLQLAQERAEAEKFDPWPVRISSSLFLILLLAFLGTLAGVGVGMRTGHSRHRSSPVTSSPAPPGTLPTNGSSSNGQEHSQRSGRRRDT